MLKRIGCGILLLAGHAVAAGVAWQAALPGYTTASPVVTDGKVVVFCEPDTLVCYDAGIGRLLWRQSGGAFDCLGADNARSATALFNELRDLEMAGQAGDHKAKTNAYAIAAEAFSKLSRINLHYWPAHSTPTPVTDGRVVVARAPTGPLLCYDLDGNRKWIESVKTCDRLAPVAPVIVGDRVVSFPGTGELLRGFDLETGKPIWAQRLTRGHYRYASPVRFTLAGRDLILSDNGTVLTPDGRVVGSNVWLTADGRYRGQDGPGTPVVVDGVAYTTLSSNDKTQSGLAAVRLSLTAAGAVDATPLWNNTAVRTTGAGPAVAAGLAYYQGADGGLVILAAETGEMVFRQTVTKGQSSKVAMASPVLVGAWVVVSNGRGELGLFTAGRQPAPVGVIAVESGGGSPVVAGPMLFHASRKTLYCIKLP